MGFATGLLTGIAEGANKVISEDIEEGKLQTRQLAKLRTERTVQRSDKRDEEFRENLEKTQKLAAQIGPGADVILKNFIKRFGMEGAVEATEDLLIASKNANVSPAVYAGVAIDAINAFPSKDQIRALAQYGTAPVKEITDVGDPSVGGFSKLIGLGTPEAIRKRSDAQITTLGGVSKQDLTGLPEDVKLPGLDKAFPVDRTFDEQKEFHLKNFIGLQAQLRSTTDSTQRAKLQVLLDRENASLQNIASAAELLKGGVDLTVRYRRQMDAGDEKGAEKTLKMINAIAIAKEGTPTITSRSIVDGSFLRGVINDGLRAANDDYKLGQGGMTESIAGRTVELDANQVALKNINRKIITYEYAIRMASLAPNLDVEARLFINETVKPQLRELKQKRDAAMQTASGQGANIDMVEGTLNPPSNQQARINPNIDVAFNTLKRDANVGKYISRAKSAISQGVRSQAYATFKSLLRSQTRKSGYGRLDDRALDILIIKLAGQGQ